MGSRSHDFDNEPKILCSVTLSKTFILDLLSIFVMFIFNFIQKIFREMVIK